MEILLLIGISIFIGTLSGKIFQKIKLPQVTGYVLAGLLLGNSGLNLWNPPLIDVFTPFINFALGIIGFMIGAELNMDTFRKRGKSIYSILFSEALVTFIVVTVVITLVTQKLYLGLIFGAISSATAPAATVDVLWESKSRGPLTTTIKAIVALDDVVALLIYGFASAFAKLMITHENLSLIQLIEKPMIDIGVALIVGLAGGYALIGITKFIHDRERILPFTLGIIVLTIGLAAHFQADTILSSMVLGFALTNIAPLKSEEIIDAIRKISAPIYVLFFILVGARMNIGSLLAPGIGMLAMIYLLSRSFGKISGSVLGGFIGEANEKVTKYIGICLFSQAGVAIGMAISIYQNLSQISQEAHELGLMIINIIVGTTFIVQLIGPLFVKFAINKAGEVGRDVTEDDVMEDMKISDVLEKNVPIFQEDAHLDNMVNLVKTSESDDFCVVDINWKLLGTISIGDLRDFLLEQDEDMLDLVLARDVAVPAAAVIAANRPLKDAITIFRRKDVDFLPVVRDETTLELVGIIHYKTVMTEINRELLIRRGTD